MPRHSPGPASRPILLSCAALLALMLGCTNSSSTGSPVNPPVPDLTGSPGTEHVDIADRDLPDMVPDEDQPSDEPILPADDVSTEAIHDLASAMFFLRESGGGVLSIPAMGPDEFAVHVWDAETKKNLAAEGIVTCSGCPTTLVFVNGWAVFQNATFPISVTVRIPGRKMETYAETSGNVLSFGMDALGDPHPAYVFGVVDNLGYNAIEFYTDTLLPDCYIEQPSKFNSHFAKFEIPVEPGQINGFSAFLTVNMGIPVPLSWGEDPTTIAYYISSHLAWDLPPLSSGDRMFYRVDFMSKSGPDGEACGTASVPPDFWDEEILKHAQYTATPTAIFLDGERYLAMGPHTTLAGEDPGDLNFNCPYFDPAGIPDRMVMAGHLVHPDGATDIVHRDWHPAPYSDELLFSGFPQLDVNGSGLALPVLSWTDPMEGEDELVRIEAAIELGTAWVITLPGGYTILDIADLGVPITWLPEVFGVYEATFQVSCTDAATLGIDGFNEKDIVLFRTEVCSSAWTGCP